MTANFDQRVKFLYRRIGESDEKLKELRVSNRMPYFERDIGIYKRTGMVAIPSFDNK